MAPLVTLPLIVNEPGQYRTRCGETVTVLTVSKRHDFGCLGEYANGVAEGWHRSGRLYASRECSNDIVARVLP